MYKAPWKKIRAAFERRTRNDSHKSMWHFLERFRVEEPEMYDEVRKTMDDWKNPDSFLNKVGAAYKDTHRQMFGPLDSDYIPADKFDEFYHAVVNVCKS